MEGVGKRDFQQMGQGKTTKAFAQPRALGEGMRSERWAQA